MTRTMLATLLLCTTIHAPSVLAQRPPVEESFEEFLARNVRVGAQGEAVHRRLRVTQIFRRESGQWKLIHRHGDPMVEKRENLPAPLRK